MRGKKRLSGRLAWYENNADVQIILKKYQNKLYTFIAQANDLIEKILSAIFAAIAIPVHLLFIYTEPLNMLVEAYARFGLFH